MALIEYFIKYSDKNKSAKVTCRVLAVGGPGPDKIRFKSNYSKTAIQYIGGSPFDPHDPAAPQPDIVFSLGKETKAFDVVRSLTSENPLRFKCGEGVPVPELAKAARAGKDGERATTRTPQPTNAPILKLQVAKGGGGTPPPDS